jgi:hypothetical protein
MAEARRALRRAAENLLGVRVPKLTSSDPLVFQASARAGETLLLHAQNLSRLVDGNLHLQRVARESLLDFEHAREAIIESNLRLLEDLRLLRNDLLRQFPLVAERPSAGAAEPDPLREEFSLEAFDDHLKAAFSIREVTIDHGSEQHFEAPYRQFRHLLIPPFRGSRRLGDDEIGPYEEQLTALHRHAKSLRRDLHLQERGHPGARWKWIWTLAQGLNPAPFTSEDLLGEACGELPGYGPIYHFLSGDMVDESDRVWLVGFRERLADNVRVVTSDFEARLGTRASAAWVLHRYARRSRRLNLRAMRQLVESKGAKRRKEQQLAEHAALFMFDQGFEVVTEQSLGQHRYDIVGEALLIEAKVYGDKDASGVKVIVDGLKQVHQYAVAFRNEGLEVEPVLLIFRVGGRLLPTLDEYKVSGMAVAIVHVDIGSAESSGRRAKTPREAVTQEQIDGEFAKGGSSASRSTRRSGLPAAK